MSKATTKPDSLELNGSRKFHYGRLLAICLVILVVGARCAPTAQIKVMTYNIEGDVGQDAGYNSSAAQNIAKIINYYQPDVLTLSEVEGANTTLAANNVVLWCNNYISCFANLPSSCYYVSSVTDGYEINAIISKYPIVNRVSYSLPPRDLLCGTIQFPDSSQVRIFTAHFKADGTASDATERQSNAQNAEQDIINWSSITANAAIPYVMSGDFNEDESNPQYPLSSTYHPITTIKGAFLNDFAPQNGWGSDFTISSTSPDARFDYILVSGQLTPLSRSLPSVKDNSIVCDTNVWFTHGQLPVGLDSYDSRSSDHLTVLETFDILAAMPVSSIRALANGNQVYTTAKVVTSSFADHFYIEDSNRLTGVRVNSTANPGVGTAVEVLGNMSSSPTAENTIQATRVFNTGSGSIAPIAMSSRDINGQTYQGNQVDGARGPFNGALLVTTWGKVTSTEAGAFYISDGSGCSVKVSSTKTVNVNDYVSVTGVIGFYVPSGQNAPMRYIETRTASDVQTCGT